jgi:hypothetical protein
MDYVDKKVEDFDPNNITSDPWATYCPRRTPAFKLHRQKGHGTSALMQHDGGALYQMRNGLWALVVRVRSEKPDRCDCCGGPTLRHVQATKWHRAHTVNDIKAKYVRDPHSGKLVDPLQVLYVCPNCVMGDGRFR